MPWKQALQDTETQKQLLRLLFSTIGILLPALNTWRLNRLAKRVDKHHRECRNHRSNTRVHKEN